MALARETFPGSRGVSGPSPLPLLTGRQCLLEAPIPAEEVGTVMALFDQDGNGSIDFNEFWTALHTAGTPEKELQIRI